MIKAVIGLILLLMPFLLVNRFDDKRKGFFYILSLLIGFQLLIAIVTQFFGVFNYLVVISINTVLCIVILIKTDYKILKGNIKKVKIDWVLILVIVILLIELGSVHYNYTGKIVTINGVEEVKNMKYIYPYYSDEWSALSFVRYSLITGKLPFVNPLWNNAYFPNPEFAFHSFISGICSLLNLHTSDIFLISALFFGIIICLLVYFILRINGIGKFASAISCLSVPYIVNSANLPGIWYAIPIVFGVICLLLSFLFISFKDTKMVIFASFLTLIFYPPLFVLSFVNLIFYILFLDINKKGKTKYLGIYLLICLISAFIISFKLIFTDFNDFSFVNYVFSKIYYMTFTKESIPDYSIWKVIPLWSLVFAVFGIIGVYKFKHYKNKLWLIAPIFIGLAYWLTYTFVFWRFIIEYQRVVFATSILIVLFSGFGFDYFLNFIEKKQWINRKILNAILMVILIVFLVFSFSYTQREAWNELKLHSYGNKIADPAPPANNYLTKEDLELFKNIWGRVIIAPPWKGLVLGAARNLYPLESKQSTITNSFLKYNDFMSSDCKTKLRLAKDYKVNYVYSSEFNCTGFWFIGKSDEGLNLYRTAF